MSAKSTWKVSAAVMASRVLGLIRDQIFAAFFGHGVLMDCFNIAFRIPNLLRDLFAEGALSQAFVTTFSKKVKEDGPESAWPLAAKMLTLVGMAMAAVSLLGILFSPQLVHLLTALDGTAGKARTFSPDDIALTIQMTRIMWPFMLLVSLAALVMGILNARNVFGIPALSSCFFNLGSIIAGTGIGLWLDPHHGPKTMIGMSIGVLAGGLGQLVCQLPSLRRLGFRWRPDWRWKDPAIRTIFGLMGPAVISASVVQINVVVNSQFATSIGKGAVSALNWAFRLMQLPIGVFGVAVATVTLPALSRAALGGTGPEFRDVLARGLRLVTFLVLPSALGLCFLAEPIISVIFERGAFNVAGRIETAAALRGYGIGLLAYSWLKVLQPAFYAANRRWIPMMVSFVAIALSITSNWYFVTVRHMGVEALATTTSLVAIVNFIILYTAMLRISDGLETRALLVLCTKLLGAGAAMTGVCLLAQRYLFHDLSQMSQIARALWLVVAVTAAGATYFGVARILQVAEAKEALEMVTRRFRRSKA
ncbi:murein biosynthesis integral membrane protein MurJ [Luteolibacter ambystomatis]|uniref:Probable lipid II flippase MurJ n=1 Tax=Luteolibacter ambystomatis TaxID=2824561 RepID=A0A975G7T8_9BACT|nr:murein biosynthesis integral membrane protein MurJ [Luteolibacter ambystomatis]QUE50351.1 murein biosynthesis integral membrane protein MurJ [Luteolibacter ambystomatis]